MRVSFLFALISLIAAVASFGQGPAKQTSGVLEAPPVRKDLYPSSVNAREEIDEALGAAAVKHKRVLLVFGGNWCYDCHVLDHALHEGAAGKIMEKSFELVHVNIGEGDQNLDLLKKYGIPLEKGVPAVAVLDESGKLLYRSGDGEFEAARRMMKSRLLQFLRHWAPDEPKTRGELAS